MPLLLLVLLTLVALLLAHALLPTAAQRAVRHLPRPASTLPLLYNVLDVRVRYHGRVLDFLLHESRRVQQQSEHHQQRHADDSDTPFKSDADRHPADAWVVQIPGRPVTVVLTSPAAFEHVLRRRFDDFGKGPLTSAALYDVLGRGIFAVDGDRWRHQRKVASRLFSQQRLQDAMAHAVTRSTALLCAELARHTSDKGQEKNEATPATLDLKRLLDRFTMDVFTQVGFGVDLRCLETSSPLSFGAATLDSKNDSSNQEAAFLDAFERVGKHIVRRFMVPPWLWRLRKWLRVGSERQLADDVRMIDAFAFGVIRRSMEAKKSTKRTTTRTVLEATTTRETKTLPLCGDSTEERNTRQGDESAASEPMDLISLFLDSEATESASASGAATDPTFIRDMTVNFLTAGRDTTSQAMAWFLLMLNRHPIVLERIRAELADKLPFLVRGSVTAVPSMADVAPLAFLEAALRESIRLHPVVPMNTRTALCDTTLHDGTRIKAGTRVVLPHYVTARLSSVWGPDAEQFNPDRWLDAATGALRPGVSPFQFSAFLAGPRACLGQRFALLEMKIAMAAVLSKFDVATVKDPFAFTYTPSITLAIDGPMEVTVERVCLGA